MNGREWNGYRVKLNGGLSETNVLRKESEKR
jgi:hypothetical protein